MQRWKLIKTYKNHNLQKRTCSSGNKINGHWLHAVFWTFSLRKDSVHAPLAHSAPDTIKKGMFKMKATTAESESVWIHFGYHWSRWNRIRLCSCRAGTPTLLNLHIARSPSCSEDFSNAFPKWTKTFMDIRQHGFKLEVVWPRPSGKIPIMAKWQGGQMRTFWHA